MKQPLGSRVVALSPHLDDAVWSVGASLADAVRAGADVTVLTVLAGDPASREPAGRWDVQCGFRSAGAAARARGDEDRRACAALGVRAVHLPFWDETYDRGGDDDEVFDALAPYVDRADAVLLPGFPVSHADHVWLARLVLRGKTFSARRALYAEEPYAMWTLKRGESLGTPAELAPLLAGPAEWRRVRATGAARRVKRRAARAYGSQLRARRGPYRGLPVRLALHEFRRGGEALAWVEAP